MPIVFACTCGKQLRARDGSAGRVTACPACGARVEVPAPEGVDLGIDTGIDPWPAPPKDPPLPDVVPPPVPAPSSTPIDGTSLIWFTCHRCSRQLKGKPGTTGHKGQCALCQSDVVVPAATSETQAPIAVRARPSDFEYQMIQIPPNISVADGSSHKRLAADYLESIVTQMALLGWDFQRVDTVGIQVMPGCLGSLLGQSVQTVNYFVVTFRRPRVTASPDLPT